MLALAVISVSAGAAAQRASAACALVAVGDVGSWQSNCTTSMVNGNWAKVLLSGINELGGGVACAQVSSILAEPSKYLNSGCATLMANGGWIKIAGLTFNANKEYPVNFTSTSGASVLSTKEVVVTCGKSLSGGAISGEQTVAKVIMKFVGCSAKGGLGKCEAQSPGAAKGEIITNGLKGRLGTINEKEATSEVGLLLEPEKGTEGAAEIATITSSCALELKLIGRMVGEITPLNTTQKTANLNMAVSAGAQKIKTITVANKAVIPVLKASGLIATEELADELTFARELDLEV